MFKSETNDLKTKENVLLKNIEVLLCQKFFIINEYCDGLQTKWGWQ